MSTRGIELNLPDLPEVPIRLGSEGEAPRPERPPRASRSGWDRLREGLTTYLPLLLMAVLAVLTGWLVKSSPRPVEDTAPSTSRAGPDYAMTGFQVQRHGADGQLRVVLEGEWLRHFAQTRTLEVEGAKVKTFARGGQITQATASRATSNDAATEVTLQGEVKLRGQLADGRVLEIDSEYLSWSTDTDRLQTHLPVRLKVGSSEVRAAGLDYDRAGTSLRLQGPVRGQIVPQGGESRSPS